MRRGLWSVQLSDISAHRSFLYGFAALWIMLLHMEWRPDIMLLRRFQALGACGVEMFILLTGFGLYGSMQRDSNVLHFYKKRFLRVFPASFIVAAVYFGLQEGGTLGYVGKITFLPFWLGHGTLWFVAFILAMYLLYPFVYRLQQHSRKWIWLLFVLSLIPALYASCVKNEWTEICRIGMARIPVFMLSCIIAPHFDANPKIPLRLPLISLALGAALIALALQIAVGPYFVRMLAYICISIALIVLLTWLADLFTKNIPGRFIYRCLTFCGGISLEIYLLYSRVFNLVGKLDAYGSGAASLGKREVFTVILTMTIAVLLQKLCDLLISAFTRIRIPTPKTT